MIDNWIYEPPPHNATIFLGYEVVNDTYLLPTYIAMMFLYFLLLVTAIITHELGHLLYFRFKLKKKIGLRFKYTNIWNFKFLAGKDKDYEELTDKQYIELNAAGVIAGAIPIIIVTFMFPLAAWMLIPYFVGSWTDIKQIAQYTQLEDEP